MSISPNEAKELERLRSHVAELQQVLRRRAAAGGQPGGGRWAVSS